MVDAKSSVSMVMTMATMTMYVQSDPTGSGGHSVMNGSTG